MATTHIPTQMRAAAMDHFGDPDVVHTEILPVPELGKHEILVHVAIAGVGTWDPDLVDGSFQDVKVRFPRVLGSDGAGTVVAIGSAVDTFAIGDRVYGWAFGNPKGGFFAEYVALDRRDAALIPRSLTLEEAGALGVAGITALEGLEQLGLVPGQPLVIFGASGGLGHVAVQLAKRLDLAVFAVASGPDGVALVERLGADRAIDGHSRALLRSLGDFAPDGFAGALVFTGATGWQRALTHVTKGGIVAWPNGVEPVPTLPEGVTGRPYDGDDSPAAFARLGDLIERGAFHVELSKIYPLDATAQALRDVQHHHVGKLAVAI